MLSSFFLASAKRHSGACLYLTIRTQTTFFSRFWETSFVAFEQSVSNANLRIYPLFPWMIQKYLPLHTISFPAPSSPWQTATAFFQLQRRNTTFAAPFIKLKTTIVQMPQTSSWQTLKSQVSSLYSNLCFHSISNLSPDTLLSYNFVYSSTLFVKDSSFFWASLKMTLVHCF